MVSGDAGVTFSPIPATGGRIAGPFLQLRAASPTVAFATGHAGTLARTTDGGETWTDLGVPTTGDVIDVAFPNASVGFALDSAGTLLKSTNGGASWALLNTGTQSQPARRPVETRIGRVLKAQQRRDVVAEQRCDHGRSGLVGMCRDAARQR